MFILDTAHKHNTEERILIDQELIYLVGYSYKEAETNLYKLGNAPGCHEPLLYVIARLVSEKKINHIIEYGSGMSSLFFLKLAEKYNISVEIFEDYKKWYDLNIQFFNTCNISDDLINKSYFFNSELLTTIPFPITNKTLIFIDNANWTERMLFLAKYSNANGIIIVDDVDISNHSYIAQLVCKIQNINHYEFMYSEARQQLVIDSNKYIDFVIWLNILKIEKHI